MQPKFYGTFYAAAVSITAIVGAFMGLVIARTMDIEGLVKDNYYKVGHALWCLVLSAALLLCSLCCTPQCCAATHHLIHVTQPPCVPSQLHLPERLTGCILRDRAFNQAAFGGGNTLIYWLKEHTFCRPQVSIPCAVGPVGGPLPFLSRHVASFLGKHEHTNMHALVHAGRSNTHVGRCRCSLR
jgi:hypothetical protein